MTSVVPYVFGGCEFLTNVVLPNTITSIGPTAFEDCYCLTSFNLPASVTSIGAYAFCYGFSLASLTIPATVTNLGDGTFYGMPSLTNVYFAGNAPSLGGPDGFGGTYATFPLINQATIYYLPRTTGWGTNFWGNPTVRQLVPGLRRPSLKTWGRAVPTPIFALS